MLRFLLPLAVALGVIFWAAHVIPGVVICVIAAGYFVSLYAHPNRDCASCGGHKAHGLKGSKNFRRCWTCHGRGHYPRLGVKIFRRDVIRGLGSGEHGRNW